MSSITYHSKSTRTLPFRQLKGVLRYAIWLSVAETAHANRRAFGLPTAWVPHLVGNSLALLLPEIYRLADRALRLGRRLNPADHPNGAALRLTAEQLVRDNADYVGYVAPAALAYTVSHPRFNIYRGKLGRLQVGGFGLDSIPHTATAYALSNLAYDTLEGLERNTPRRSSMWRFVRWFVSHKSLTTGAFLAGLTLIYELGEYRIYRTELKARNYDRSRINMMWDVQDTIFDVISNGLGWLLSAWRHRRRSVRP